MTNNVTVAGMVESALEFCYETHDERFFSMLISSERDSGTKDYIPVVISEKLIDVTKSYEGEYVIISGEFRTRNEYDPETDKSKLILYVFPETIDVFDVGTNANEIYLEGYICKPPTHRTTPLGREITDVLIAVNRNHGKSDYIPCILWGRNAKYVSKLLVGSCIRIAGRVQSRIYKKGNVKKTAYEVSCDSVAVV